MMYRYKCQDILDSCLFKVAIVILFVYLFFCVVDFLCYLSWKEEENKKNMNDEDFKKFKEFASEFLSEETDFLFLFLVLTVADAIDEFKLCLKNGLINKELL